MGLMLIVAWLAMVELLNREVAQPWPGIVAGAVILVTAQAASFGLQAHFGLRHWGLISQVRPVGELVALGLFIRAGLQKAPQLFLVREFVPNRDGEKFPPTSVGTLQGSRMVH